MSRETGVGSPRVMEIPAGSRWPAKLHTSFLTLRHLETRRIYYADLMARKRLAAGDKPQGMGIVRRGRHRLTRPHEALALDAVNYWTTLQR